MDLVALADVHKDQSGLTYVWNKVGLVALGYVYQDQSGPGTLCLRT